MNLINKKFTSAGLPTGAEGLGRTSKFGMRQGFRNSIKRWREREILLGESFYQGGGNLRSEFDHLNFFQS